MTEHKKVRDGLERAVNSDPGYADAWAYLCFIYLDEYRWNYNPQPEPLDRALDAAQRAVALDSASQRAHFALGEARFFRKELEAFLAEAERVIALNPNNSGLLAALGLRLSDIGDERAVVLVRRAIELDPFHPTWFHLPIAQYHFQSGEYEEALAEARKITMPGHYLLQGLLAAIYAELGRQREARSAIEELLKLYPGFTTETLAEEWKKFNATDERIRRWVAALRKAGLPE